MNNMNNNQTMCDTYANGYHIVTRQHANQFYQRVHANYEYMNNLPANH